MASACGCGDREAERHSQAKDNAVCVGVGGGGAGRGWWGWVVCGRCVGPCVCVCGGRGAGCVWVGGECMWCVGREAERHSQAKDNALCVCGCGVV